jgi:hypothetical protein
MWDLVCLHFRTGKSLAKKSAEFDDSLHHHAAVRKSLEPIPSRLMSTFIISSSRQLSSSFYVQRTNRTVFLPYSDFMIQKETHQNALLQMLIPGMNAQQG